MRLAMISLACAVACGGGSHVSGPTSTSAELTQLPVLAWVPGRTTYLVASPSVTAAQHRVADTFDGLGVLVGYSSADFGRDLARLLTIDPLSADGVRKLGVDPTKSIAMFSEGTDPTLVVPLADPTAATSFFDAVKGRVKTQSVVVDGIEVSTATIARDLKISFAVDKAWLFVHFAFGLDKDDDWFGHAHKPHAESHFATLPAIAKDTLLGQVDGQAILALIRSHAPNVSACLDRYKPIGFASFSIDGSDRGVTGRLAFDLGPSAAGIARSILPPPPGFDAIAQTAPLAVQWNLDVAAIAQFLSPCLAMFDENEHSLMKAGVRAARVAVVTLKPDDRSGTGVVSTDLVDKTYLAKLLDEVPQRSMFESKHKYGAFDGKRISVPFFITLDYILDDAHGMLAVGEGMMDKLVIGAVPPNAPVFAADITVAGFSPDVWMFLIKSATGESFAKRVVEQLSHWHDGHVRATVEGNELVISATGNRR